MAVLIKRNNGYDSTQYKEIQLNSTSSNTDSEIKAEIAAYETALGVCAIGSEAYSFDFNVYYRKKNDGTWASIL